MTDTLIKVESVSKKFCLSLKKSLWYGLQGLGRELIGRKRGGNGELRDGEFWALNDVSFEVKRGQCLGLIGSNGAGKTTLLRILNGLINPDSGRIEMRGRVGAMIALGAGFNPILTGRENIYVNASVYGLGKREIDAKIDEIIDFAELGEFIDAPVQSYSSGMAVRLGFAIVVKTEPDILLLDEVLAVGDVSFQAKCFNTLAELRERGTAFILVSHNMHQISRYSNQVLFLEKGEIANFGDTDQGIARYLANAQTYDSRAEIDGADWSKTYGSGKVVFTGMRFRNAEGDEISVIDVGGSVTLEIDYERREEFDGQLVLDVIVRDSEGVVYQGTNERSGITFDNLPRRGRFLVKFERLPLNADYAEFFFSVLDHATAEVFDWKRHVRLGINRSGSQLGRIQLPVTWSIST